MTDAVQNRNAALYNTTLSSDSSTSTSSSSSRNLQGLPQSVIATPLDANDGKFEHPGGKFSVADKRSLSVATGGGRAKSAAGPTNAEPTNWGDAAPGAQPLLSAIASHLQKNYPNFGTAGALGVGGQVARDDSSYGDTDGFGGASGMDLDGTGGYGGTSGYGGASFSAINDTYGTPSFSSGYGDTGGSGGSTFISTPDGPSGGPSVTVSSNINPFYGSTDNNYSDNGGSDWSNGEQFASTSTVSMNEGDGMTWTATVGFPSTPSGGTNGFGGSSGFSQYDYSGGTGGINDNTASASVYNDGASGEPDITSDLVGQSSYSYEQANPNETELFSNNGPTASDVTQGDSGDCFFLASLSGVAAQDPNLIKNNIQPAGSSSSGSNLYDVTLYYKGKPETVQVDDKFLANDSTGSTAYAGLTTDSSNSKGELWPALYEKAFAQFTDTHPDVLAIDGQNNSGTGYQAIGNGGTSAAALGAITGQTPSTYAAPGDGSGTWSGTDASGNTTSASVNISDILQSANAGDIVTAPSLNASSFSAMPGYNKQTGSVSFSDGSTLTQDNNDFLQLKSANGKLTTIPSGHEYTVMGMDPTSGNVILRNPWGSNPDTSQVYDPNNPATGSSSTDGTFELSTADFQKMFGSVNELPNPGTASTASSNSDLFESTPSSSFSSSY